MRHDHTPADRRISNTIAVLIGIITALIVALVVILMQPDGVATATTTAPVDSSTTSLATTTTTTTQPTTTTVGTTTTTLAAFVGTVDDKTCVPSPSTAGSISAIRSAQHPGFTRIVFDFTGDVPGCFVTYDTANTLFVVISDVVGSPPHDPSIFDGSGTLLINTVSVVAVTDAGVGGGSQEWTYRIELSAPNKEYRVFTLEGPSRLVIDIAD